MVRIRFRPPGLPTLGLAVSLLWLGAACLAGQEPPKQPQPTKGPSSSMTFFTQAKPDDYLGEEQCVQCHSAYTESFNKSPHAEYVRNPHSPAGMRGCEACHGPGKNHLEHLEEPELHQYIFSPVRATPKMVAEMCLRCHNDTMTVTHWRRTGHARANISCTSCHYIHKDEAIDTATDPGAPTNASTIKQPIFAAVKETGHLLRADQPTLCGRCHRSEVSDFRRNFHHPVPEGRLLCSDCHEAHPTREGAQRSAAPARFSSTRDKCVTCHAETAGPFVYEHDPSAGWTPNGCVDCHRPHGSHNPKLLTLFSRGLCNQCHTDKAATHFPGHTCWDTGCHVAIHGSNTDPRLLAP